jgi:predicted nucleic acid-binding Zn ribbon protein
MTFTPHHCPECGNRTTGRAKLFCSSACRQAFNNRRMQRGAQLYDLFRAMRRERDDAKTLGLWKEACRLEFGWQEEDDRERPGRRSYVAPRVAIQHLKDIGAIRRGEIVAHNAAGLRRR